MPEIPGSKERLGQRQRRLFEPVAAVDREVINARSIVVPGSQFDRGSAEWSDLGGGCAARDDLSIKIETPSVGQARERRTARVAGWLASARWSSAGDERENLAPLPSGGRQAFADRRARRRERLRRFEEGARAEGFQRVSGGRHGTLPHLAAQRRRSGKERSPGRGLYVVG